MHNMPAELSRKSINLIQPAIQSFEREIKQKSLPATSRASVVGRQIHHGRSLESANHAISAAKRTGQLAQVRPDERLFLVDGEASSETLLDLLTEHTESSETADTELIGAINARRQQLRVDHDE